MKENKTMTPLPAFLQLDPDQEDETKDPIGNRQTFTSFESLTVSFLTSSLAFAGSALGPQPKNPERVALLILSPK